jgi:hypothetical protein
LFAGAFVLDIANCFVVDFVDFVGLRAEEEPSMPNRRLTEASFLKKGVIV